MSNQIRVNIKEKGYSLLHKDGRDIILENEEGGQELWTERDDFAGFVLVVDGTGYEFVRSF